ncbi:MAG: LLM class flavin-dependent oxidoreductase [Thaumarchaeota archaeon]|nr:LLM class flavin-dependent oxidoreductase [Nitrososphaerota archaeon]
MDLGVALSGATPVPAAITCARTAEEVDLDSIWITESTTRESFSVLGALAASTRKIKLGAGIINVYTRPPALTAMGIATVDEASNGRAILALGVSNKNRMESGFGLPYPPPAARTREYVEAVRRILSGEKVALNGETLKTSFQLGFKPQRSRIPIFIAALRSKMIKLASEVGDGVLLYFRSPETIKEAVGIVRQVRSDAFKVASFVNAAIGEDGDKAEKTGKKAIVQFVQLPPYQRLMAESGFSADIDAILEAKRKGDDEAALEAVSRKMLRALAVAGTAEDCRSQVKEYSDLGLSHLIFYLHPVGSDVAASLVYMAKALKGAV